MFSIDTILAEAPRKACFKAGNPLRERDPNDPIVIQAIEDLEKFLRLLPKDLQSPNLFAGTNLPADRTVLCLSWWGGKVGNMCMVSVVFYGDGNGSMESNDLEGFHTRLDDVPINKLAHRRVINFIRNL